MSFEEIIYLMETAEDYTDLYDAAEVEETKTNHDDIVTDKR